MGDQLLRRIRRVMNQPTVRLRLVIVSRESEQALFLRLRTLRCLILLLEVQSTVHHCFHLLLTCRMI